MPHPSGAIRRPNAPWSCKPWSSEAADRLLVQTRTVVRGHTPHMQGRDIKMAQTAPVVGIDLGAARWDVACYPHGEACSFTTDPAGQAELRAWLRQHAPGATIACEASGGLERQLARALAPDGLRLRILDAARVRKFASAGGK